MKHLAILVTVILLAFSSTADVVELHNGSETLFIEINGVTNVQKDPDYGWYTYRRDKLNFNISVNPRIQIIGGHCVPNGYFYGQFTLTSRLVVGWEKNTSINRYLPVTTPLTDSIPITQANGLIDYSAQYQSMHGLYIQVQLVLNDPIPVCDTGSMIVFSFILHPEPTASEFLFTTQANEQNGSQAIHKVLNCNACVDKGLPGFAVNMATLLPVFSDVDYAYQSYGPDLSFSRHFYTPMTTGSFGDGWTFSFMKELQMNHAVAVFRDGTGLREVFELKGPGQGYTEYRARGDSRKYLRKYNSDEHCEIYDPTRKLFYVFGKDISTGSYLFTSIHDWYNRQINLAYNAGKLISVTDAAGRITTFEYSDGLHCSRMTLPDGRFTSFHYQDGRLSSVTDMIGNISGYTYDSQGFITGMSVNGKSASFTYTQNQGGATVLSSVSNLDGNITTYEPELIAWNSYSRFKVTDPEGNQVRYYADLLTGSTHAIEDISTAAVEEYGYNDDLMLISVKSPMNHITLIEYDSLKQLSAIIDSEGNRTTYSYDTSGNLVSITDAENKIWKQYYSDKQRITATETPSGSKVNFTWNNDGLLSGKSYETGQTYSYEYDNFGNLSVLHYPNGGQSIYEYDEAGINLTGYTDPEGNHTTFEYDALDRITKVTNPDGSFSLIGYDCCAPVSITDENGNMTYIERNNLLKIKRLIDPMGQSYAFALDDNGRLTSSTGPANHQKGYVYDSRGRVVELSDELGEITHFEYNADGLISQITDPSGNVSAFQYSSTDHLMSGSIGNSTFSFSRDHLGRMLSYQNGRGQSIAYSYTPDGLLQEAISSGIHDSFSYDIRNRLVSASNEEVTLTFHQSEMNAPLALDYNGTQQFGFSYSLNNRITGVTYSDDTQLAIHYNQRGRVSTLVSGNDSLNLKYDAASHLTGITRSNGMNTVYTLDKTGRITSLRHYRAQDTIVKRDYVRDVRGFITDELREGLYAEGAVFMPADTGGFFSQNRVLNWQGKAYYYDPDGNLSRVGENDFLAEYDELNRLTTWTVQNGATQAAYTYDALGRVAIRTMSTGSTEKDYYYYYDHKNRLLEVECPVLSTTWKFYYAGNLLTACRINGSVYFYHFDQQGNTIALSNSNGNVVQTYSYDPWGKILDETGAVSQPFKYSGAWGVLHEDGNIYRMPFRFYDAFTGRFIQRDPAGFIDGSNLYQYAGNNPVNRTDPSGLYDLMVQDYQEYPDQESEIPVEERPEAEVDKQQQVDQMLNNNQWDIFWINTEENFCEGLKFLIPGVSAGEKYADGRPWYEVAMEYAKNLPPVKVPVHVVRFLYYHGQDIAKPNKDSNHAIPVYNPHPHHTVEY